LLGVALKTPTATKNANPTSPAAPAESMDDFTMYLVNGFMAGLETHQLWKRCSEGRAMTANR
jgi:hypothetical protein